MKLIELFTDGAVKDNQSDINIGGYGGILHFKGHEKEYSGGERNTTNNIMELKAVIEGLKAIKDRTIRVEVFTDSAYIVNCFKEKWYEGWISRGWMTTAKKPVENRQLWEELLALVDEFDQLYFYKIKGHLPLESIHLEKWYNKFLEEEKRVSMDQFKRYLSYNHRVDKLASDYAIKVGENDKE
ncbi:MAG: ribonuclease HI [Tissierellia bacterium]|nr:ribonuclease HI [Tissierellia bacterium]